MPTLAQLGYFIEEYWARLPIWLQWLLVVVGFLLMFLVIRDYRKVDRISRQRPKGRRKEE